ncbi:hypothetical protein FFLO_06811 [Filobasidium floriforme]|uniref:DNA-directed RNA polymerase III subunit RPC10 n=1 Tax=Filobasidium floriforme TaxID=5210 RepID=A0A8K0NMH6_9TREE|nr:uncharacterized protein HD553DRAFT_306698 [Filobasidium floriforme]KAG7527559.1 hypothetical protein FFLO_06811 [Filobasidium floriforme]KAH8088547.1 hypothetical protein HD553DRAFT_306698 [Filobasidium floriforme]
MLFCPYCSNFLTIEVHEGTNRWRCNSCPYIFGITKQMTSRTHFDRKEVDDVMGGEEGWKNVDQGEAQCPKCDSTRAYFRQLQIRSADEPMTTFLRCVQCKEQWREASPRWLHTTSSARTDILISAIYRIEPGCVQQIRFQTLYSPSCQHVHILRLSTRSGSVSEGSNRSSLPGLSITVLDQAASFHQERKRL